MSESPARDEVHALAEHVRSMMRALVLDGHATPQAERIMVKVVNLHDNDDRNNGEQSEEMRE